MSGYGRGTNLAVIGPQYCVAHPMDLTVPKKSFGGLFGRDELDVTDANGDIVFKVLIEHRFFGSSRRILADAAGNLIVTMKPKSSSSRERWEVFRGHSTDTADLIFSVRNHSRMFAKSKFYVFMAANSSEQVCDFRIEGNLYQKPTTIYFGESNIVAAQVSKKKIEDTWYGGKKAFGVIVNPNVDYAFIIALAWTNKEIYDARPNRSESAIGSIGDAVASSGCGGD